MSTGAIVFLALSWLFVLGLTGWAFMRILRSQRHFDPDGIGPDAPPQPARFDETGEPPPG